MFFLFEHFFFFIALSYQNFIIFTIFLQINTKMANSSHFTSLYIPLILIVIFSLAQHTHSQFSDLQVQDIQKLIDQQIKGMAEASKNITFHTIKEEYLYIYYPFISECLQNIGEEFQPFIDSILPAGISAASIGLAAGAKVAITAGIIKTGILGFLKVAGATILSSSVVPVTIGIGAIAYYYKDHTQNELKQKCKSIIMQMNKRVNGEQLKILLKFQQKFQKTVQLPKESLLTVIQQQKTVKSKLSQLKITYSLLNEKYGYLKNYLYLSPRE